MLKPPRNNQMRLFLHISIKKQPKTSVHQKNTIFQKKDFYGFLGPCGPLVSHFTTGLSCRENEIIATTFRNKVDYLHYRILVNSVPGRENLNKYVVLRDIKMFASLAGNQFWNMFGRFLQLLPSSTSSTFNFFHLQLLPPSTSSTFIFEIRQILLTGVCSAFNF